MKIDYQPRLKPIDIKILEIKTKQTEHSLSFSWFESPWHALLAGNAELLRVFWVAEQMVRLEESQQRQIKFLFVTHVRKLRELMIPALDALFQGHGQTEGLFAVKRLTNCEPKHVEVRQQFLIKRQRF